MAKRDPAKTARNKQAAVLGERLKALLPTALEIAGCSNVHELNAKIGSKHQQFMNVKQRCIRTADEFMALYMEGLARTIRSIPPRFRQSSAFYGLGKHYQSEPAFREYVEQFLERTFLRHYDELARVKPSDVDAQLWIGANNANYGLLVTPRFNEFKNDWENDKSEIRRFRPAYFTIGHVLETGLVIPDKNRKRTFSEVSDYLSFFVDSLVRATGSVHQVAIAERYLEFVEGAEIPQNVPLLIPELRYRGRDKRHKYRLDFCAVDPYSLAKIGFELSPWSTHGQLSGTKKKTVARVNEEAKTNFEREIRKYEAYFIDYGIHVTVFTDSDLVDHDSVFARLERYLKPEGRAQQLLLQSRRQLLDMDLDAEVEVEN